MYFEENGKIFAVKENPKGWLVTVGLGVNEKLTVDFNLSKEDYATLEDVKKFISNMEV